ncbi:MAG: peptidase M23, partial [Euryarchaeota archaeon]|nr:peptidase M23 [Euryarchaeota archaeon]
MKLAASYGDIRLMAPDDAAVSFFKSPFAAHETGSAVDIAYGDFGSPASSPVDGVIVDIREFETPTPFRDRNFKEYLTAVRCGELIVRILHVKPDLGIGDHVRTGEDIGTFIRSGYFYFWNFSHLHVEVRMPDDYLRATSN